MNKMIRVVWNILDIAATQACLQDSKIVLDKSKIEKFAELFQKKYNDVKSLFMKKSVKYLDRHKVASIIIASVIEADVVQYNGDISETDVFIGKYLIAVSVGLNYMQDILNKKLEEKGQVSIEEWFFPTAFSCKTPYLQIFARNLYFTHEKTDWKINLLNMSENLFFIEYITLKENGIDPSILNEEDSDEV